MLNVSERTKSVFETQRIVVLIVSFYKSCLICFKIFLRVHAIRILLHIMSFGLLAKVNALLQVVFHNIHLSDDSLNAYQLISHFATEPSWCDKVSSQIPFKTDLVVLHFAVELGSLIAMLVSLKKIFGDAIILLRVFDEILGS